MGCILHLTIVKVKLFITLFLVRLDLALCFLRTDWVWVHSVLRPESGNNLRSVFVRNWELHALMVVVMSSTQEIIVFLQLHRLNLAMKILGRAGALAIQFFVERTFHCLIELWFLVSELRIIACVARWPCQRLSTKKS